MEAETLDDIERGRITLPDDAKTAPYAVRNVLLRLL